MSALPLFYAPELSADVEQISLSGAEARHMTKSRRFRQGDCVVLGDGMGQLAKAEIVEIDSKAQSVKLTLLNSTQAEPKLTPITLYVPMPKGERQMVLIEMATQLGVSTIVPLITQHSIIKPNDKSMARWRRACIEASKQSRRSWFSRVDDYCSLNEALEQIRDRLDVGVIVLDSKGASVQSWLEQHSTEGAISIFIGPEGGFHDTEMRLLLDAGASEVSLGPHILRIETAAVAIIAALNAI